MADSEKIERYQKMAEFSLKAQRFDEAIGIYRQLIELSPDDDSCRLALAWAYHDNRQTDEAVACFEQIFEKELSRRIFTGFAFDELVRIFKANKKHDKLIGICERAVAAQPDDVALLSELGEAYLKAGRPGDAVGIFEKITAMEPDAPSYLFRLGQARIMNHDFDGAETAYRSAAAADACEKGSIFGRMAEAYILVGQLERAKKVLYEGLAGQKDDPLLLLHLAEVLIKQGKPDEASIIYDRIIEQKPADAAGYLNRFGHALARAHHHREAVAVFKKAIALESQNPFLYKALAQSYMSLGETEAAAHILLEARRLSATG